MQAAASVTPPQMYFFTMRRAAPPFSMPRASASSRAAQTAARSQTLSTPVTWLTNSEGVNAPSCSASVPLSYV